MVVLLSACSQQLGPVAAEAPIFGGGLAVEADGTRWLADPDRSAIVRVGKDGRIAVVALPASSLPDRLALTDDYVVAGLRGAGAVVLVDRADLSPRTLPVCAEPRGIDVAGDDSVWVACADGLLVNVDPRRGVVRGSHAVDMDLRDVVVDGDLLWVSRFASAEVLKVDATTGEILMRLRPPSVDADHEPVSSGVDPFSPSSAWRMRAHPDGGVVLLHQRGADGTLDDAGQAVVYYGSGSGCDGVVHTTVTTIGPDGSTSSSRPIAVPALAVDLAVEDDGTLALALLASDAPGTGIAVRLIDPFTDELACASVELVDLGSAAEGAHGSAVEATPEGLVVAQRAPLGLDGVALEDVVPPRAGWDLFHRATPDGVACVSCHPDGHEDGRTWRFLDVGVRRTQVAARASAPFHWAGELPTLDDLLAEVHVRRMGSRSHPTSDSATALGEFLAGVPPRRAPTPTSPELVEVGRGLFHESGCADCHTDAPQARAEDVGTGGTFQVPSLAGLAYRMPLMHDGCAATIRDRFDPACGGANHGDAGLGELDLEALVAFLTTL